MKMNADKVVQGRISVVSVATRAGQKSHRCPCFQEDGRQLLLATQPGRARRQCDQSIASGVLVPGSVSTTIRARPGADQTITRWFTLSKERAAPAASRDSPQRAMDRRVSGTPASPRRAASQTSAVAICRAFDLPAMRAACSSQSKRTGPTVWTEDRIVTVERSAGGMGVVTVGLLW